MFHLLRRHIHIVKYQNYTRIQPLKTMEWLSKHTSIVLSHLPILCVVLTLLYTVYIWIKNNCSIYWNSKLQNSSTICFLYVVQREFSMPATRDLCLLYTLHSKHDPNSTNQHTSALILITGRGIKNVASGDTVGFWWTYPLWTLAGECSWTLRSNRDFFFFFFLKTPPWRSDVITINSKLKPLKNSDTIA